MFQRFTVIFTLSLIVCFSTLEMISQDGTKGLREILQRRITIVVNDIDEELFLSTISRRTKVPLGFLQIRGASGDPGNRKKSIAVRNGTVEQVLDRFVGEDPRYKWVMIDGVVNVLPTDDADIIKVLVSRVDLRDAAPEEAEFSILDLPDVRASLKNAGLSQTEMRTSFGAVQERSRFSLSAESVTLQEILNQVVRSNFVGYWSLQFSGPNFEYVRLSLQ